jgi:LPXTG-motif cell wall-anchored protein
MKASIGRILLVFSLFIMISNLAFAQESPKFNFGTMQPTQSYTANPGARIPMKLYFYNIFGNKITHVTLSLKTPEGWNGYIEPDLHEITISVGGLEKTIEENLHAEPTDPVPIIPEEIEYEEVLSEAWEECLEAETCGIEYIRAPGLKDYIKAKYITIIVEIPEDAELGKTYTLKTDAKAQWYGQTGQVSMSQFRDFDWDITVISSEPEKIIKTPTGGIVWNTPTILGIVIGIVLLILLIFFKRRRS